MLLHMMFRTRCFSCGPEESVRGLVHCVFLTHTICSSIQRAPEDGHIDA
jgi:hypothetical protein